MNDSNSSFVSSSEESSAGSAAGNSQRKKFQSSWLQINDYKYWLRASEDNPYTCMCSVCNVQLSCGKSELNKHSLGRKHQRLMTAKKCTPNAQKYLNDAKQREYSNDKIKMAEIKIALFFALHNVALHLVDELVPLLKNVFSDSKVAAEIKLSRTKATEIINNVLYKHERDKLIHDLQTNQFSILIDESTDITCTKKICLLTRYFLKGRIITQLLELLALDAKDCSAQKSYEVFKNCMTRYNIPLKNIVGVACDGANVMVGQMNSFFSYLRKDIPDVVLMRCVCHSSAIVASKACETLPRTPEDLVRGITNYVTGSAKRCAILQELQEYFFEEQKKVLKLSNTRWLCMYHCVTKILDNLVSLTHFFELTLFEDKLKSAENILTELKSLPSKAYLHFLKYVLNYFNTFNGLFQSNSVLIHKLSENSNVLLKQFCQNFLSVHIVLEKDLGNINLANPSFFKPIEEIYLGPECQRLLRELSSEEVFHIRRNCLNFYICAAQEMQKRLPVNDKLLKELKFLDPAVDLNAKNNTTVNLTHLPDIVPGCDKTNLALEWRNLPFSFSEDERKQLSEMKVEEMWHKISVSTDHRNESLFPNLSKIVKFALTLPHSNAQAERIFSIITDVKTKKRNRLGDETVNSICVIRSSLSNHNLNCVTYEVKPELVKLHNVTMYKHKNR